MGFRKGWLPFEGPAEPSTDEHVPLVSPPPEPGAELWPWPSRGHHVRPTTNPDGSKRVPHALRYSRRHERWLHDGKEKG